jgi:FixJ family two-component response regulator
MVGNLSRSYTVSVVDDDKAIREALSNLLELEGLHVETFGSAEEFVTSPPAARGSCLILDVQLPGMSGLELQHRLSQNKDSISTIFITGRGDDAVRDRALLSGAVAFFLKPFDSNALLEAVRSTLK